MKTNDQTLSDALFDLDSVVQLTTATLKLKHPISGLPTGVCIELAGPEHAARQAIEWERTRAIRAEMESTGKYGFKALAEIKLDAIERLVACTLGWSGLSLGGQPLAYSADACTRLYADPKWAWVRDKVKEALDQRELFIGGSAAT